MHLLYYTNQKEEQVLNRTIAPDFQPINKLAIHQPESIKFDNGLQAFVFQSSELELIKFEFVFANIVDENELPLLNTALATMLKEGTSNRSSAQIADDIDFYGAYLMPEYSFDHTSLTLYTMHKYVDKVLPIVLDILQNSIIPQKELDTYIRNNKQSLEISLKKNDFVARRLFYQNVFGNNRYGAVPTPESFDAMKRDDLVSLYKKQIIPQNCTLFIAGNVGEDILHTVTHLFGKSWLVNTDFSYSESLVVEQHKELFITDIKPDALQSAIRLGGISINRQHPDYPALQFVNTLFGGFFGSRLMRNIREDKGYTYSIGSAVVSLKHTGFLTIASEVGVDVTQNTLTEIEKEFSLLRNEEASEEEISLVKNYMQGVLLGSLESIFSHADKFKAVYFSNMDLRYYDYYAEVINTMDSNRVLEIAKQYFNYDKMVKIVVGQLK